VTETVFFTAVLHPNGQAAVVLGTATSLEAAQGICSAHSLQVTGHRVLATEWRYSTPTLTVARSYHVTRWISQSYSYVITPPASGDST
jgi:hypothetical protein